MTRLVIFALAWCSGIVLAQAGLLDWPWLLPAIPASLVLVCGWWRQTWARRVAAALLALLLGSLRFSLAQPNIDANHIAWYNDSQGLICEGVVIAAPEPRNYDTRIKVRVERIILDDGPPLLANGKLQIYAPPYSEIRYGDRLRFSGTPITPPVYESFNYRDYLMRYGVYSLMRHTEPEIIAHNAAFRPMGWLLSLRDGAHQRLLDILPEPSASLLSGILLGIERGIPDDLSEDFTATGTSHIIAISGFNLTLIAAFIARMSKRILKKSWQRLGLSLGVLWVYVLFVGAAPAVLRAGLMATLVIIAQTSRRGIHGPTSLAAAALIMSAINPWVLWDAGFQLSFAATTGLIIYTEPWTQAVNTWLEHRVGVDKAAKWQSWTGWFGDNLIVTLAAQLTTLGVIVSTFKRISVISLLTNVLILPVQNYIMILGALALLAGTLSVGLGRVIALPVWSLLSYTITCVARTARIPHASLPLEWATGPVVFLYYCVLIMATWWYRNPQNSRQEVVLKLKQVKNWIWLVATTMLLLLFTTLYFLPDGQLHMISLDVQGEATLLITPSGKQVLIDGGADGQQTLSHIAPYLPITDRSLDSVILTAPDDARLPGLIAVLQRYDVETLVVPASYPGNASSQAWQQLISEYSPGNVMISNEAIEWDLGDGVLLRSIPYSDLPDAPLVLSLEYGAKRIVLGGAVTAQGETQLAQRYGDSLQSSVFVVPRLGDATAATPALLNALSPAIIILPSDIDNPPSDYVLARLHGFDLYRTDELGDIAIITDGQNLHIENTY